MIKCCFNNPTDLFPGPAAGSDVLDLFLLSESSDKAKGFTLALQPWVLVCRRSALRSGQSIRYCRSAISSVPRAEAAVTSGTVRRTWCESYSLLVWKHKSISENVSEQSVEPSLKMLWCVDCFFSFSIKKGLDKEGDFSAEGYFQIYHHSSEHKSAKQGC